MIRSLSDWQTIAYLIGWCLAWLLGWFWPTPPARGAGWDDIAVRVVNQRGPIADLGSGTIAAGNGQTALVITCKHIFDDGRGVLTVERTNHQRYNARLLGTSRYNDVAALEIPDPGVRTLRIAERQPPAATLIGWGDSNRAWKHRGDLIETDRDTVFYSFVPLEGDSGGGVFDDAGALTGVVWGTDGSSGAVVPLADLRRALDSPTLKRYWPTASTTKAETPMLATPLILAAGMLAQSPPLPGKNAPLSVQPSPQGQTFAPQSLAPQVYDVPITVRVRVQPEIDVQSYAPRPQAYAQPQVYSGGGCYGGSYSGGFSAQYQQTYAAPAVVACPGGFCYGGSYSAGGFGLGTRPFGRKIKIKEGPGIGLGPRGLRELLGR